MNSQQNMGNLTVHDILTANYDRKLEKPVLYLSRMLSKHEHNYWPTELEIARIVWAVQKTRHLEEGTNHVKIYTDHKSAEDILTSTSLKTNAAVCQNCLRLLPTISRLPKSEGSEVSHTTATHSEYIGVYNLDDVELWPSYTAFY
jgi:hypothetical protein